MTDLDDYIKARNESLRTLDTAWARKQLPGADDDMLLCILHKARYECTAIEEGLRNESARWLREQGYGGITGPLLPEGELPRGPEG